LFSNYGFLPAQPVIYPPVVWTIHLGGGGGGYTGGEGGEFWYREADPYFNPGRYSTVSYAVYNATNGTNWRHSSVSPLYVPGDRVENPETFYQERLLSGAIFVSWEASTGFEGWSTGSVRVGPEEGW
jgi:hypothetical protein